MRRRHGWLTAFVTVLLVAMASPAGAAVWHFETLDGAGGPNGRINADVGNSSALAEYGGQPHVWYWDGTHGDLRHAWWTGTQWYFETLDGAGGPNGRINANVGVNPVVTLYGGQPHVWYRDVTSANLRHAWWNGTQWSFETLDGAGGPNGRINADVGFSSAVTLYGGQPHVWYLDATNGALRHAWWTGTQWSFETLDGAGGPNGRINADVGSASAVTLYGEQPHVWYHNATNGRLRHAWWNGTQWSFETLDGAGGPNGRINANVGDSNAATLYEGQPHVWYHNATNGRLRHAWWTGTQWSFETLDGAGGPNGRINADVGLDSAVTLYEGQPHVSYYDFTDGYLRHACWTGTEWSFETLDGAGGPNGRVNADVGDSNAVNLSGGRPHVSYYDFTTGDLRRAWWG